MITYQELLSYLTKKELDLLKRMYSGLPDEDNERAIQQIKATLCKRDKMDEDKDKAHTEEVDKIHKSYEKDIDKLNALENGGVDNWEFYGEALNEWFEKY